MFGPSASLPLAPNSKMRWVKSQYSVSDSPLCANTGVPATASAAAAWSWVEKMLHEAQRTCGAERLQRLDQHRGLDRHVQRAGDARALERLAGGEFLADRHQAGHLGLGDRDFLAAPVGERQVGDLVVWLAKRV